MVYVTVDNVSVNYPLYSAERGGDPDDKSARNQSLIRSKSGKVIGVKALQDVSFHCAGGDRIGVIGRNGSGKSTLLKVLAGTLPPDEGRVLMQGRTTSILSLGLGTQWEATGRRNVVLTALAADYSREEIDAVMPEIEKYTELGPFFDLPVSRYSTGMQMRLKFATATAFNPDILILDEWLSTGDAAFRKRAEARMHRFVEQAGVLILASHSEGIIKTYCDKALWIDCGVVRALGPVQDVLAEYSAASEAEAAARGHAA